MLDCCINETKRVSGEQTEKNGRQEYSEALDWLILVTVVHANYTWRIRSPRLINNKIVRNTEYYEETLISSPTCILTYHVEGKKG